MQTWFECKVKYQKVDENGKERNVSENFLLDAVSFTDAEARITKQMVEIVSGEFTVMDIKKSKIAEVFPFEDGEWWFKATINIVTIDEEQGREKKIRTYYIVMADDIQEAVTRLDESLSFLIVPYVVTSMAVSTIVDVFPYDPSEAKIPENLVPLESVTSTPPADGIPDSFKTPGLKTNTTVSDVEENKTESEEEIKTEEGINLDSNSETE